MIVANAIIARMLPDGAVKGGSSLKFRFGDAKTRATSDLDVARRKALDDFVADLQDALALGWEGFTGTVAARPAAHPDGVPAPYVMQPFDVKLSYLGKPWCTVRLEVGHDEIGDADEPERVASEEADAMMEGMGFPAVGELPLMRIDHQIAQKLHALSEPESERAHDLIDLQVIMADSRPDMKSVRDVCVRLFGYRQMQPWPTYVRKGDEWESLYAQQLLPEPVLQSVDEAIAWVNALIDDINEAI